MKNSSSSFNFNINPLNSTNKSFSNAENTFYQKPGLFKKHSENTNQKFINKNFSPKNLNQNLFSIKSTDFKKPTLNLNKKPIFITSMENLQPLDKSYDRKNENKNPNIPDFILKQRKNTKFIPKSFYSGNDLNENSQFQEKNYSTFNNFSYCSTDIKLDQARLCKSKQKGPFRRSVNQKQNVLKIPHTRHVSSYASFNKPLFLINTPKVDMNPKNQKNFRLCKTSIKQLQFPDSQQQHQQQEKETHFEKVKKPFLLKFQNQKEEVHFQKTHQRKISKFQHFPLQKLFFKSDKIDSQVNINVSSEQEIENLEITARFNYAQQKNKYEYNTLKDTTTSIENDLNSNIRRKINLSQFIIGPCKGKGRYGKVYFAIQKQTGWICALKQLPISVVKQMLPQFINQIKTQSFLDHPYINKIYGCFVEDQKVYLIMQYMIDGSLYDLIKKNGPVPEKAAANKLHQISQALSNMHSYHIIHRDLKPENIVLTFGVCKICDFGWAVKCSKKRQTSCGTLDYLSPQMVQGTEYSSSIDLWAMGVLLYEMLVGKPPFYNISVKQTTKKIKQCNFTLPQKLSLESKSLIECFLRKNPGQRRQIDGILRHPFFQKVSEE